MSKITILVGISGSGKSTEATNIIKNSPKTIVINRDSLRSSLFCLKDSDHSEYYRRPHLFKHEKVINSVVATSLVSASNNNFNVVLDNTNVKWKYLKPILSSVSKLFDAVEVKVLDTSLDECIRRDKLRSRQVGECTIKKQYEDLKKLKASGYLDGY